jgi:VanZ family protein
MILVVKNYWKSILVLTAIFLLSFMNPPSIPTMKELFSFDKIAHLIMYSGFTFVLLVDTSQSTGYTNRRRVYLVAGVLFPVFIGALTEVLQTILFAPRSAEWGDFFSDSSGVAIGWLMFYLWRKWKSILT